MEGKEKETEVMEEALDIYTPLEEAKEEVRKHWSDKALRKEVDNYLVDIPEPFQSEPRFVLGRNIMTPGNEFVHFLKLSSAVQLSPLGLEFLEGTSRAVSRN